MNDEIDAIPEEYVKVRFVFNGSRPYPVFVFSRYWHPNSEYVLCEEDAELLVSTDLDFHIIGPAIKPVGPCAPCIERQKMRAALLAAQKEIPPEEETTIKE